MLLLAARGSAAAHGVVQSLAAVPGLGAETSCRVAAASRESDVLGAATAGEDEHPFVAIAVLALVGALLLAMLMLVARFLRGSWNP